MIIYKLYDKMLTPGRYPLQKKIQPKIRRHSAMYRRLEQHFWFLLLAKGRFLTTISIFRQNFLFWPKFRFFDPFLPIIRWGQQQTRSLTQDEVEVGNVLQRAMQALAERPVLFRYTLDEYATARRSTTVRGFIDALTRGSRDQSQPRPIGRV